MNEATEYIDFTVAAKSLPNRPHSATLWRWARRGVKVRGAKQRIHLQHVRAGGRVLTTHLWLDEFMAELARADMAHFDNAPAASAPTPTRGERSEAQRHTAAEAASRRLKGDAA